MIRTFSNDIRDISLNMKDKSYYTMEITITDECNLRCTYCFEGDACQKTTTLDCVDDIFIAIDKMFKDQWFMDTFMGIRIGFWGGEPTLRPDILKRFADRYNTNNLIQFHIYTNGVDISELMDIFKDYKEKIKIQVSYDGKRINDIKRLTKNNTPSTDIVRANIYELHEKGYRVSIKSTATYDTIEYMTDSWDDIKSMNDDLGNNIKYSVTMDYVNTQDMDMTKIKKSFMDLAKKEIKFFKEKGYHLFTWFSSKEPNACSFFKNGMAINTNGGMMYCHGCGYSPSSESLVFGDIRDEDFLEKIKHNFGYFEKPKINECENCYSTICITCNVVKYDNSKKEEFLDKWYDLPCQEKQCNVFKEFSKISISLSDILKEV